MTRSVVAHTVVTIAMLVMLLELLFDRISLLVIDFAIFVGIELFENALLEFGASFGELLTDGFLLLVINFTILVGVKTLHETSLHRCLLR